MVCKTCNGTMVGDGYTMVLHCENVDDVFDLEPDANPVYCENPRALVFLDDEREFKDVVWVNYQHKYESEDIHVVRNMEDFIATAKELMYNGFDVDFSFDHDLQCFGVDGSEITGKKCLENLCVLHILEDIDISKSEMYFHTMNPIGKENMETYYKFFKAVVLEGGV